MLSAPSSVLVRLVHRLVGPQDGDDEVLAGWPSDTYPTGVLYAPETPWEHGEYALPAGDDETTVPPHVTEAKRSPPGRASVVGLVFMMEGERPRFRVRASAGRYTPIHDVGAAASRGSWRRTSVSLTPPTEVEVLSGSHAIEQNTFARWWVTGTRRDGQWEVALALENTARAGKARVEREASHLFQVDIEVTATAGRFVPRRVEGCFVGRDDALAEVLVRGSEWWAAGRNCGATWERRDGAMVLRATWVPVATRAAVSANGRGLVRGMAHVAFDVECLANAEDPAALGAMLSEVSSACERRRQEFATHIERIRAGITLLTTPTNVSVRRAFQLAQAAMLTQHRWRTGNPDASMTWSPFQLAYQLVALCGVAEGHEVSRAATSECDVMDVLVGPSESGKTEAQLALAAFAVFLRGARSPRPALRSGLAVMFWYASAAAVTSHAAQITRLVLACELVRRRCMPDTAPITIGLWRTPGSSSAAPQLSRCPACGAALVWRREACRPRVKVACVARECPVGGTTLPVTVDDDDLIDEHPSVVVSDPETFARALHDTRLLSLFDGAAPDLVVHEGLDALTSRSATLNAVNELAFDILCRRGGLRPKYVGSTTHATFDREVVRACFDRACEPFVPSIIERGDVFFRTPTDGARPELLVGLGVAEREVESLRATLRAVGATLVVHDLSSPRGRYVFENFRACTEAHGLLNSRVRATPFAPRARDAGFRTVLAAIARFFDVVAPEPGVFPILLTRLS